MLNFGTLRFNKQEVAFRELHGLGVAMRRGDLFETEHSGLKILRAIHSKPMTLSELVNMVSQSYNLANEIVRQDTVDFVVDLINRKLIIADQSLPNLFSEFGSESSLIKCWKIARTQAYRCGADALFDDGAINLPSSEALRVINEEKKFSDVAS